MALLIIKKEEKTTIAVWEITESLDDFKKSIDYKNSQNFKSKKRQLQFLCTRLLLTKINKDLIINYNIFGAPEINNGQFISISHSNKLIAIIISDKKAGIDIEEISNKALKVSSKFLSSNDKIHYNDNETTLCWCAKETMFKWHQKGNISFKNDIIIQSIKYSPINNIHIEFMQNLFILKFLKINNHFLVYVCK
jgi:4'-phosphopantetheinyl transferase